MGSGSSTYCYSLFTLYIKDKERSNSYNHSVNCQVCVSSVADESNMGAE